MTGEVVHCREPRSYDFAGSTMKLHLSGAQTGGGFAMLENLLPPDYSTPPHVHQREDEAFLILEGELDILVGGRAITVRAGESAFAPRGIPHQLRNTSGRPVRALVISTPAGFGDFVVAASAPARPGTPPASPPEDLMATAARFGIELAA